MHTFLLLRLASPKLNIYLSLFASFFLNKELIGTLIFGGLIASIFPWKVFYVLLWFLLAIVVFSAMHADEFAQKLTLMTIREEHSYFLFLRKFILARVRLDSALGSPAKLLRRIDDLLLIGRGLLLLHHQRSLVFLLGMDYRALRDCLLRLEDELRKTEDATSRQQMIADARKKLEPLLIRPLECLETPFLRAQRSRWGILPLLASIGRQPSYDRALETFNSHLTAVMYTLAASAWPPDNKIRLSSEQYRSILAEVVDVLAFFKGRCWVRVGFPLFEFIDRRTHGRLTENIRDSQKLIEAIATPIGTLTAQGIEDRARHCINGVLQTLVEFEYQRGQSNTKFAEALTTLRPGILDCATDAICVYGFSQTVLDVLLRLIPGVSERRETEVILIQTDDKATTLSEEHVMRNALIDNGFSNVRIYSWQDFFVLPSRAKTLNFFFGFEVIDSSGTKAIFHFGAGQVLRDLLLGLEKTDAIRVYLIGASYKQVEFRIDDAAVEHSSVFEMSWVTNCLWINEGNLSRLSS